MSQYSEWQAVIGLEIHVELNTRSKLFSVAPNRFGDVPNTNITEVCTGQPGSLPVLNKEAVRKAVQFGCAINATISKFSTFDRKSYFYPDSPRNYQITQLERPIIIGGTVVADVDGAEKTFQVNRVHLEDDAGMLKHFPDYAGVDYNRAGVPLIEIVSEPCLTSAKDAVAYCMAVKAILEYIGASDCNMEEGSLRVDANISVKPRGEEGLRNKIEIKNMNSFSNMEEAIDVEIKRQTREYLEHPHVAPNKVIAQATYRWDPERKETVIMRRKEDADDYRYFPEPDLLPIVLTDKYIDEIRSALPELPMQRERRYIETLGLTPASAFALTSEKRTADFFEEGLALCSNARALCNWMIVEFAGRYKEPGKTVVNSGIPAVHIAALVEMIDQGTITGRIAKSVAEDMVKEPGRHPREIVAGNPDYQPNHDTGEIEKLVEQVVVENMDSVSAYKSGKEKAFAHLIGQVMKLSKGKASPPIVNELLRKKLDN